MGQTKNEHYIPQCILRGHSAFHIPLNATKNQSEIYLFNPHMKCWELKNINEVCCKHRLYEDAANFDENDIENAFSRFESDYSNIRDKIIGHKQLNFDDYIDLFIFAVYLHLRNPDRLYRGANAIYQMFDFNKTESLSVAKHVTFKTLYDYVNCTKYCKEKCDNQCGKRCELQESDLFAIALNFFQLNSKVLKIMTIPDDSDDVFLIGDKDPVSFIVGCGKQYYSLYNDSVSSFYIPITSKICLSFITFDFDCVENFSVFENTLVKYLRKPSNYYTAASSDFVNFVNTITVRNNIDFGIYSSKESDIFRYFSTAQF